MRNRHQLDTTLNGKAVPHLCSLAISCLYTEDDLQKFNVLDSFFHTVLESKGLN